MVDFLFNFDWSSTSWWVIAAQLLSLIYLTICVLFTTASIVVLPLSANFKWAVNRWRLLFYMFALMFILGILLFPINYGFRKPIRRWKIPLFWWFLDSSEADYISNTYGDAGWRETHVKNWDKAGWIKRIWIGFRWSAIRNSHWNFVLAVAPKQGEIEPNPNIIINETVPETDGLTFCNSTNIKGKQYSFFKVKGREYFRYSFTKNTWFFGKKQWNVQLGTNEVRYVYKNKYKTI